MIKRCFAVIWACFLMSLSVNAGYNCSFGDYGTPSWGDNTNDDSNDREVSPGYTFVSYLKNISNNKTSQLTIPVDNSAGSYLSGEGFSTFQYVCLEKDIPESLNFCFYDVKARAERTGSNDNRGFQYGDAKLEWTVQCRVGNEKWRTVDKYIVSGDREDGLSKDYYNNQEYIFSGKKVSLDIAKLFEDMLDDEDGEEKKMYERDGQLKMRLRFVYYFQVKAGQNHVGKDDCQIHKMYCHTSPEKESMIVVNRCEVGDLSPKTPADTSYLSLATSEEGYNQYALYEGTKDKYMYITSSLKFGEDVKSVMDRVIHKDALGNEKGIKSKQINDKTAYTFDNKSNQLNIKEMFGQLTAGDMYDVSRVVTTDGLNKDLTCESQTIRFQVVPEPEFVSEDTVSEVVCPYVFDGENFNYKEFVGSRVKLDGVDGYDDRLKYGIDSYKPLYRWVCNDGTGFKVIEHKEIDDFNPGEIYSKGWYDANDGETSPNLKLPFSSFKAGKTYHFRQRVYLRAFGKDVYVDGGKTYKIKVAKGLDPERLILSIDTSKVELSTVCKDDYIEDVKFSARYGENEDPSEYKLDKFSFSYAIGGVGGTSVDSVDVRKNLTFEKNVSFSVKVEDGCAGSIIGYDSIVVRSLPEFVPENIVRYNDNIEIEYIEEAGEFVRAIGINGRECKLKINDTEWSDYDYYYESDDHRIYDMDPFLTTKFDAGKTKNFKVYKREKNGNACVGGPVSVQVVGKSDIAGNRFEDGLDTIYVCKGSYVTNIYTGTHISPASMSDVFGDGPIKFRYLWQYSVDGMSFLPLKHGTEDITSESLLECEKVVNSGLQIRRIAFATYENNGESTVLGSDTSDILLVLPFSAPEVGLTLDGDTFCYGETVVLKPTVSEKFSREYALMSDRFFLLKYDLGVYEYVAAPEGESEFKRLSVGLDGSFVMKGGHNLHAGLKYCGDTIFTSESRVVRTHSELNVDPTVGNCVIVGDSVDVKATRLSSHLAIIMGVDTLVEGDDEVTARFYVIDDKNLDYKLYIRDEATGCENTIDKSVSASVIEERMSPVGIGVNGIDIDTVCAGVDLYVKSKNDENDEHFYSFSWKVDGIVQQDAKDEGLNHKFTSTGSSHVVERTANYYKKGEFCYSVTDTMRISTFAPVAAPEIEVSADAVCHGGEVTVTVTAKGGGQNRGYKVLFSPEEIQAEETIMEGESLSHTFVGLNKDTRFSVEVSDERCSSKMYKSESEDKLVKVEKDLAFSVSTTSKIITLEDFKDNAIKILFDFDGVSVGDSMMYKVNSGKENKFMYDGTALSLTFVDSTDFASGNVHLDFVHYGSVASCSSEIVGYDITINEGFDGIPNITSAGVEDTIEVCAGTDVKMELAGLDAITFDEKPISEMADGVWAWYRNNSPVEGGSANGCVVKAEAGKSKTYYARFSAKDAGGKTRRLWSNPFTVIGKAPIKLEKIRFDNYQSQDFIEFCEGSDARVAISTPQSFDGGVSFAWQYSTDGGNWYVVPDTWAEATNAVMSLSVDVLGDKTTWFRLSVTDTCGQTASSNLLKVQFKGDVPTPSPVLTSTRIYDSEGDIPVALEFARSMSHSPYLFFGAADDEGKLEASDVGGRQSVSHKDGSYYQWSFGENSVRVVGSDFARVSEEICYSDTVKYEFRLFKKLATPQLSKSCVDTIFCPGDDVAKYLDLNNITGGDSATYKTYWQYSTDNVNWYPVKDEENDGFTVGINNIIYAGDAENYSQKVSVSNLRQTTHFRAIVDCEGGYPGTSVMSNTTQTFHVYSPMSDGGIDDGKITVCYASVADSIKGKTVEGGSGRYIYEWQWSKDGDDDSWEDVNCTTADFGVYSSNSKFALTEKTFFRRVVTDEVCGTTLKSGRKEIDVKTEMILPEDYVHYSALVPSGNAASMQGLDEKVQKFIWYNSPNVQFATSVANEEVYGEPLEVPLGDESMVRTYYVQGVIDGCPTTNKLPLKVLVYNQSGGDIMFDGEDYGTSSVITCSGYDDIELLSVSDAPNAKFKWYYSIGGGQNKQLQGIESKSYVTTPSVRLDTVSGLVLAATEGRAVNVRIFRVSEFSIEGTIQNLSSDTLTINIVPTLQSVNKTLKNYGISNLAGEIEIKDGKMDYCLGEHPNNILGFVDQGSALAEVWNDYKNYFGPWLFDNEYEGGFRTYYEYSTDGETWMRSAEYDYSDGRSYAGDKEFSVTNGKELDATYTVRRVLTDGCTSVMSEPVALRLMDGVPEVDSIGTYGLTPEMPVKRKNYAIRTGYEIGDSIIFENGDPDVQNLAWFADAECTDTLCVGESWCSMVLDSAKLADNGANMYVQSFEKGCFGETVAIPFEYGTLSSGGEIFIGDSVICRNGLYDDILSLSSADGMYISPEYRKMEWSYAWQYKWSDSEKAAWTDISGATGESLASEDVNMYVKDGSPLHIRRVATNDKGRVRYSNALRLTRYDALVPGELYADGRSEFCEYDALPYVKSTSAVGGKVYYRYGEEWQYSVNGGEWISITVLDSLYLGRCVDSLDRSVSNMVSVRCLYSDECEMVEGEAISFIFHRHNAPPTIYQNNDSCNASVVKLSVYGETDEKSYRWSALYTDPSDSASVEEEIWFNEGEHCTVVRSHLPTNQFGVRSTDIQTGCVSEYFRFNVDSLPALDQEQPSAPHAVCPGEDLTVRGGKVSGGNHDKSYRWQMSSTGEESDFADIAGATGEDMLLEAKYIKGAIYVRRIIEDMCYVDTSVAVMVALREAVVVTAESLKLNDRKCENSAYTVYVDAVKDSSYASEWWSIGADTIREVGVLHQMVGFEGDSVLLPFRRHLTDSLGLTCVSDEVTVVARNKPGLDASLRDIETDDLLPCNESYVEIRGGRQNSEHVTYKWYVNGVEQIGKNSADLSLRAADTMRIVRVMTNGCASVPSETLVMVGQRVFPYDYVSALDLKVVTDMSDSSVVLEITNSKAFSDGYKFVGDGEMPSATSNSILLPYDCVEYKDSILDIQAVLPYCVTPYTITPFRGGEIGFEGSTSLCGGGDVPAIVVTELEGGNPAYETTFQWQYRNVYTPDFVNIDGATGKTYVPAAVDVETTYRRIASRGVYRSVSNELTLSIRPLPEAKTPVIGFSDEEMDEMGLKHGDGFYEWFESVETYLVASATEADEILWEKSLDGETWISLSKGDSLKVSDPTPTVYYRVVASSACGADTSLSVVMSSRQIAPLTDELTSTTTLFICHEKPDNRGYRTFGLKVIDDEYLYSFRLEADRDIYYVYPTDESYLRCFDGRVVLGHECFGKEGELYEVPQIFIVELFEDADGLTKYRTPACDVTVHVTRHDTATGLSVSRPYLLETNSLRANFTLQVEDGEVIDVREHEGDVAISQGDRVQFHATPTGNKDMSALTYDWVLQEPVNRRLAAEGRRGLDGLTSKLESPSCYYYNGGYYPMKLVVSDGVCTSELLDTTLYIPQSSVRAQYSLPMELAQEDGFVQMAERIEVSPRLFSSYLDILSSDPDNRHEAVLTDEVGRVIWRGDFAGSVRILTDELASAVYMVVVDGVYTWKVVKR